MSLLKLEFRTRKEFILKTIGLLCGKLKMFSLPFIWNRELFGNQSDTLVAGWKNIDSIGQYIAWLT